MQKAGGSIPPLDTFFAFVLFMRETRTMKLCFELLDMTFQKESFKPYKIMNYMCVLLYVI